MRIEHLFTSPGHNYYGHHGQPPDDFPLVETPEIDCVAGRGIRGDRFFDYREDYKGQVTFFSREVFTLMSATFGLTNKSPGVLRRNLIVSGINLMELIGTDFELQGVQFRGTAHCAPCYWMDTAFAPGAEKFLAGRGGLRARILTDGRISLGRGAAENSAIGRLALTMRCSAVLLAGGKSSRMGRDKAFLEFEGEPLWQHQIQTLKNLSPEQLMISGPSREEWNECEIVADEIADAGPLAGVAAALRKCTAPLLVVLAVDLPRMTTDFLRSLCTDSRGAVPWGVAGFEPLAAVYPAACAALATQALGSGDFSMQDFVRRAIERGLLVERLIDEVENRLFANLNTPADL